MSVGSFILRRLSTSLIALIGVSLLVFFFLHLIPGDPVDHLAGGEATAEQRAKIAECMNLDESLPTQFGIFLGNVANGSLGHQCPNPEGKPTVMDRIVEVFPYTASLAVGGMLVALFLALPLGVVAAIRHGSWVDTAAGVVSLSGISMPVMWMGPLFLSIFFDQLGVLPGPAEPDASWALVLPSFVVGTHLMAMLSRMTRSSMVEVLRDDYIRTARAKGLPERTVIFKHALRNALLPVITIAGLQFGSLLGGAIITEKVFARPGLGTLLLEGITTRNYPMVQGTVLVIAFVVVSVNMAVDVMYGIADPRIRRGRA